MRGENPFLIEEYTEPKVSGVIEGRWMRHSEYGEKFVPENSYAPFYMNGWRLIDEVERLSELQRLATANATGNIENGGTVEGTTTGDNVSQRRDTFAELSPLPGSSTGLQVARPVARQTKSSGRRKSGSRTTI